MPARAAEQYEALKAALAEATEAGRGLSLEIDGERPLPCALQLLSATLKSATGASVPVNLGPRAEAATQLFQIAT